MQKVSRKVSNYRDYSCADNREIGDGDAGIEYRLDQFKLSKFK